MVQSSVFYIILSRGIRQKKNKDDDNGTYETRQPFLFKQGLMAAG
jgi:hypothetical protein